MADFAHRVPGSYIRLGPRAAFGGCWVLGLELRQHRSLRSVTYVLGTWVAVQQQDPGHAQAGRFEARNTDGALARPLGP